MLFLFFNPFHTYFFIFLYHLSFCNRSATSVTYISILRYILTEHTSGIQVSACGGPTFIYFMNSSHFCFSSSASSSSICHPSHILHPPHIPHHIVSNNSDPHSQYNTPNDARFSADLIIQNTKLYTSNMRNQTLQNPILPAKEKTPFLNLTNLGKKDYQI